jgi:hypothetical protein
MSLETLNLEKTTFLYKKARINMKAGWIKRKQKQLNNYVNTSP